MSRTGHRSVGGVRAYKRVSDEQRQALSDVLNTAPDGIGAKKRKLEMGNSENTDTGDSPSSVHINYCKYYWPNLVYRWLVTMDSLYEVSTCILQVMYVYCNLI